MICRECTLKEYCYAEDVNRTECDDFAKSCKNTIEYYKESIGNMRNEYAEADEDRRETLYHLIDQEEDWMLYAYQDIASGPIEEFTDDNLPF